MKPDRSRAPWTVFALCLAIALALAPALAEARAGSGTSAGSRGTRTFQAPPATPTAPNVAPIERSMTSPTQPTGTTQKPASTTPPVAAQPQPSFFQSHPFLAGMMGGLIGAGIGGLLFGNGLGLSGLDGAGFLGLLFQLALIGGAVWFVVAMIRRRAGNGDAAMHPAYAGAAAAPTILRRDDGRLPDAAPLDLRSGTSLSGSAGVSAAGHDGVNIGEADYAAFEQRLGEIQNAWSRADLAELKRFVTPEMLSYFAEGLATSASRGLANRIEDVKFETGDLAEAWREGDVDYASVAMRWSACDYTVRAGSGEVVEGSRTERSQASEMWTFLRAHGGSWILSAIQQV